MQKIIWTTDSQLLQIFNTQSFWILIQGWEKGQESHYIQHCNLSSALLIIWSKACSLRQDGAP
jgi:hypothetical protein